jgi:ATP-dependent DNA helicase RecG
MFQTQRRRFFPLPEYDLSNPERVAVEIQGRILDERYTRLLMANTDLDLATIMLLDRVQKRHRISPDEHHRLKAANLVEGRYPKLIVAAQVAEVTGDKARHIRERGFNNRYYRAISVCYIC